MSIEITYSNEIDTSASICALIQSADDVKLLLNDSEFAYLKGKLTNNENYVVINRLGSFFIAVVSGNETANWQAVEKIRVRGNDATKLVAAEGLKALQFANFTGNDEMTVAFAEGAVLGAYNFSVYKTDEKLLPKTIDKLSIVNGDAVKPQIDEMLNVAYAVCRSRDWINEPVIELNAPEFAEQMKSEAELAGLKVAVYDKAWIEKEKMGGLLAVNYGSVDEPRFTVMEWAPENAVNEKPLVLVGKGIVFDTGGISLKPSSYMEWMKADMGGASAIAGAMLAIAKNKVPVSVVALVPSTDNRPSGNAYVPGDVIRMRNGKTVEVLNTDAEGRMILADALDYAASYDPDLVIDVATLTGSAANTVGEHAVVTMGTADDSVFSQIDRSGFNVYERVVRFPFWDEYGDMIKSDIADIKNVGGPVAGAITAGKFLEHFVSYPWVHLDISGSAFLKTASTYRGKGGSGFGVRLLYDFIKNQYSN